MSAEARTIHMFEGGGATLVVAEKAITIGLDTDQKPAACVGWACGHQAVHH